MDPTWTLICMLVAFVAFVASALGVKASVNFLAIGLAAWVAPALWAAAAVRF